MNILKKIWGNFTTHTPLFWVRIGHGLIAAATFGTASQILYNRPITAMIVLFAGMVGYFIVNCNGENHDTSSGS